MIEFLSQPWHWAISGLMITLVVYLLLKSGQSFGISSSFRALCSAAGGGKNCSYFDFDWRTHYWLFYFVIGTIIGGYIASHFLASPSPVAISADTIEALAKLGITSPVSTDQGMGFIPMEIYNWNSFSSPIGWIMILGGGFLIGFGARWAGGCTSGHAISGLSNLQPSSLVAVIGFFIGGLIMTHFLLPIILNF